MTRIHDAGGIPKCDRQRGKNADRHRPDSERFPALSIHKVDADSVPYGEQVSQSGRTVWACYHNGRFVCCGATHDAARRKYIDWHTAQLRPRGVGTVSI